MDGKIAVISGAVFAGIVGAAIIASEVRGSNPVDTLSSAANSVGIGNSDSSGKLVPLPSGDVQIAATTNDGSASDHEPGEHANRGLSGSRGTGNGDSHEDDD